jgi:ApbE superfamily uncharacterized protein (UPF0280 family)
MYEPRSYRDWTKSDDLIGFQVGVSETDLYISAEQKLAAEARNSIHKYRQQLQDYIAIYPEFQTTLEPYPDDPAAPSIIREMTAAAAIAGVGPFAAVAGAIAERIGKDLLDYSSQIIIENGGDIFLKSQKQRAVGIYAGSSPLSNRLALEIEADQTPLGICTSSGTVGHSLSFGKADAVVILAKSTAIADAVATAVGNLIQTPADIPKGLNFAKKIKAVKGVALIKDDRMGIWGEINLRRLD